MVTCRLWVLFAGWVVWSSILHVSWQLVLLRWRLTHPSLWVLFAGWVVWSSILDVSWPGLVLLRRRLYTELRLYALHAYRVVVLLQLLLLHEDSLEIALEGLAVFCASLMLRPR